MEDNMTVLTSQQYDNILKDLQIKSRMALSAYCEDSSYLSNLRTELIKSIILLQDVHKRCHILGGKYKNQEVVFLLHVDQPDVCLILNYQKHMVIEDASAIQDVTSAYSSVECFPIKQYESYPLRTTTLNLVKFLFKYDIQIDYKDIAPWMFHDALLLKKLFTYVKFSKCDTFITVDEAMAEMEKFATSKKWIICPLKKSLRSNEEKFFIFPKRPIGPRSGVYGMFFDDIDVDFYEFKGKDLNLELTRELTFSDVMFYVRSCYNDMFILENEMYD